MADKTFDDASIPAVSAVASDTLIPVIHEGADGRLYANILLAYIVANVTLSQLAVASSAETWLQEFLAGGTYSGGDADARAALGVDPAGAGAAAVTPVASALTALVESLHAVAYSGSLSDLSMPELQEQMLLAATPAEVRTAIGAAPIGGSGFTWRHVTGVADNDTIVVANTDTGVVIIDGGFGRLYFDMPEGVEDGQEVVIVITGTVDVVIWLGAGTVIQNHAHFNEAGGAGYTLKWIDAASSWIVLG